MRTLAICLIILPSISAIFLGGSDCGCNTCCAAPAPCAPQPICSAPAPCPQQSCGCNGGGYGYSAPLPICPPKYIILNSPSSGGYNSGGSYSSGPVIGSNSYAGSAGYSSGASYSGPPISSYNPAPTIGGTSYSEGGQSSQQIAAAPPPPPSDADYMESAGASNSASTVSTSPAPSSTDHPTYNTNAREYGSKNFNNTDRCPNVELLHFIDDAIVENDIAESKRKVSKSLNTVFTSDDGKPIDVICAGSKLSYRLTASLSCEHTKGSITCIAYKQA